MADHLFICGIPITGSGASPVSARDPEGVWHGIGSNMTGDANQIAATSWGSGYVLVVCGSLVVEIDSVPIVCNVARFDAEAGSLTGSWIPWGLMPYMPSHGVSSIATGYAGADKIVIAGGIFSTFQDDEDTPPISAPGVVMRRLAAGSHWEPLPSRGCNGCGQFSRGMDQYYPGAGA
ncbi:MAG: hypothetical protein ABFC96_03720 [Thermoguttaceae bacterium]